MTKSTTELKEQVKQYKNLLSRYNLTTKKGATCEFLNKKDQTINWQYVKNGETVGQLCLPFKKLDQE